MSRLITAVFVLLLSAAAEAAEKEAVPPAPVSDSGVTVVDRGNPATGKPDSEERSTPHSLSTVITRGEKREGLTMQEKWSDDVVVCKRQQVIGSRMTRKVCHTRGEWQAMRNNARESMDAAIREALIYGVNGG